MYQSVTTWQAENYEVDVTLGGFTTIYAAVDFSFRTQRLTYGNTWDHLVLTDGDSNEHRIDQNAIAVRRLKPKTLDEKFIWNDSDFVPVDIPIEAFRIVRGLDSGFRFSAYTVRHSEGKLVSAEFLEEAMAFSCCPEGLSQPKVIA